MSNPPSKFKMASPDGIGPDAHDTTHLRYLDGRLQQLWAGPFGKAWRDVPGQGPMTRPVTAGDQIAPEHSFAAPSRPRREIERTETSPEEVRFDISGPLGAMATVDGYVMCRRPGRVPFVLTLVDWHRLPLSADLIAAAGSPRATVEGVRI